MSQKQNRHSLLSKLRGLIHLLAVLALLTGILSASSSLAPEIVLAQAGSEDSPSSSSTSSSASSSEDLLRATGPATTAAVPAEFTGIWKGTITADPDLGDFTFTALLAIGSGNVGEIIGTAAHPSISCIGIMRLQGATADTLVVNSDYMLGNCLDGTHRFQVDADGNLVYEWHDPSSDRVDRGTLTRSGGTGTAIPDDYKGVWQGTIAVDPDYDSGTFPALVTLIAGDLGELSATIAHSSVPCGGEMTLTDVRSGQLIFRTDYTYGDCISSGTHILSGSTGDTMDYDWHAPDSDRVDSGVLERISGAWDEQCMLDGFGDGEGNPIRQDVGEWADDDYGGTYVSWEGERTFVPFVYEGEGLDTIARWGCYLTSGAMIVNYYASVQGSAFRTDPEALNTWLQEHEGYSTGAVKEDENGDLYVDSSGVIPAKVAEYARDPDNGVQMSWEARHVPGDEESVAHFIDRTIDTLNAEMCGGDPAILGVTNAYGPHFVAASGKTEVESTETWRIHDPGLNTATTLLEQYENVYNQVVRFSDAAPDRSLFIGVHSPVEVVLTDSEGRRVGYNPIDDTLYDEIPGASYGVERLASADGQSVMEMKVLDVPHSTLGEYTLRLMGTADGEYALEILATDDDGVGIMERVSGDASPGSLEVLGIDYTGEPGTPISVEAQPLQSVYLPLVLRQ